MEEYEQSYAELEREQENVVAGFVGAFLFSFAGVVLWFVIYQLGYIAAIAGIVTVICAIKGYEVFGKALSPKGLIVSIVVSVAMIFIAEYISIGYKIYVVFKPKVDITIFDALRAVQEYLKEEDFRAIFLKDLAMGYAFTLFASIRTIINVLKKAKAKAAADL
jgi:hypothetical protein